jgi:hypothetical protein
LDGFVRNNWLILLVIFGLFEIFGFVRYIW